MSSRNASGYWVVIIIALVLRLRLVAQVALRVHRQVKGQTRTDTVPVLVLVDVEVQRLEEEDMNAIDMNRGFDDESFRTCRSLEVEKKWI